jgi:hypothetical protein
MNITFDQIYSATRSLLRIFLPATVFLILCTGIFGAFFTCLLLLPDGQKLPVTFSTYCLGFLILFLALEVAFCFFEARFLRKQVGHKELPTQRFVVFLSGIPFYIVEILFILTFVYSNDPNIPAAALFVSAVGALGFFIISCVYFFLTWFLLKRSTTIGLQ